jgi:hypothetical protein
MYSSDMHTGGVLIPIITQWPMIKVYGLAAEVILREGGVAIVSFP